MYKTWIETLFPQARRTKTTTTKKVKKPEISEPTSGSESAGAATGNDKGYDESWIPEHHIARPTAKRVKSGASGKVKKAD